MQNASTTMPRPRRRGGPRQHSQTVAGYSARSDTAACGIWLAATLLAGSIAAAAGVVPTYDNGIVGLETCQGNTGAGLTAGKKNAAELFLKHVNQDASFKENLKYTHPGEKSALKIDTSTLERLIERKLEIAQRILSRGKRVVDGDPLGRELNSVTREIIEELARVVQEAENRLQGLSTEEVEKIAQRDFARVFAMSGKLDGVVRELLERKLIAGYKRLDMPMLKKAR